MSARPWPACSSGSTSQSPDDLRGRDPHELFDRLCELDGRRHDPCLLDTFVAVVSYADGGPARPWWEFSRERKGGPAWLSTCQLIEPRIR